MIGFFVGIAVLAAIWWPFDKIAVSFEKTPGLAPLVFVGELGISAIGYVFASEVVKITAGVMLGVAGILGVMANTNRG